MDFNTIYREGRYRKIVNFYVNIVSLLNIKSSNLSKNRKNNISVTILK